MLRHDFTSPEDTSDRMYVTSASIVRDTSTMFASWLDRVNALIGARNFPVHVEVRVSDGHVSPIEFNPLRFAGLGGTDVSWYGYGTAPTRRSSKTTSPTSMRRSTARPTRCTPCRC